MENVLLSHEGLKQLDKFIEDTKQSLNQVTDEKNWMFEYDTNTWHDNFPYEELTRRKFELETELENFEKSRKAARIIEKHGKAGIVDIDDIVMLKCEDEKFSVRLTGNYIADIAAEDITNITLNSPMQIFRKKIGDKIFAGSNCYIIMDIKKDKV